MLRDAPLAFAFGSGMLAALGRDLAAGTATLAAYSAGIALVLIPLTLAVGLAKGQLVRHFRRVLPHVGRASGALLTLTGAYVAYTAGTRSRSSSGTTPTPGPVRSTGSPPAPTTWPPG